MKKLRTFKCATCKNTFDAFVKDEVRTVMCKCGDWADRQLSKPKHFGNSTGRSPSAI